ncbi:MAG: hypothetical protein WC866_04275 [Patescibacteria group bacterium]
MRTRTHAAIALTFALIVAAIFIITRVPEEKAHVVSPAAASWAPPDWTAPSAPPPNPQLPPSKSTP